LADICPVGALLDRDFRFKCRVWYLGSADSICPGCSRGCNIRVEYNASGRPHKAGGDRVMRLKPRLNPDVNGYWMCDVGRYGYKFIDSKDRLRTPTAPEGNGSGPITMEAALDLAAERIRSARGELSVIASPQMSNEELILADRLFRVGLEVGAIPWRVAPSVPTEGDGFLLQADRNPNTRGAELLDLDPAEADPEKTLSGRKGAIIFGHDLAARPEWRPFLEKLEFIIYVGPLANETSGLASIVLPSAVYAEKEGTFTNFEGIVQKFHRALEPLGESLPEIEILQGLASRLGVGDAAEVG
ncbi:MAG: molybdopterin-dependent oxidoreductase, partial [Planctomycetota bacterium]|nr:molybdopterin-dependent oxidoreductase [Planctomycetota bacterium]